MTASVLVFFSLSIRADIFLIASILILPTPVKPAFEGSGCFLESSLYPPAARAARRFSSNSNSSFFGILAPDLWRVVPEEST